MKYVLIFIFLLTSSSLSAQTEVYQNAVVFVNKDKSQSKSIEEGSQVLLLYKGYLSQEEIIHADVVTITDSSLIVIKKRSSIFEQQLGEEFELKLKDLMGFKKVTPGRVLLKSTSKIALGVGSALVFALMNRNGSSFGAAFGTSAGIGLVGDVGIELLFRDRIKYKLADGWAFKVFRY